MKGHVCVRHRERQVRRPRGGLAALVWRGDEGHPVNGSCYPSPSFGRTGSVRKVVKGPTVLKPRAVGHISTNAPQDVV